MEIKIQMFGRVFSLIFGYKTLWFEQITFFSIIEEWFNENLEVCWASHIYSFWRKK